MEGERGCPYEPYCTTKLPSLATTALRPWRFCGALAVPPMTGIGAAEGVLLAVLEDVLLCEVDVVEFQEAEDEDHVEVDVDDHEVDVFFLDDVVSLVQGDGSTHWDVVVGGGGVHVEVGAGFFDEEVVGPLLPSSYHQFM